MILVAPETVNCKCPSHIYMALLDSGSNETWFDKKALPLGCETFQIPTIHGDTLAGTLESSEAVFINRILEIISNDAEIHLGFTDSPGITGRNASEEMKKNLQITSESRIR